MAEITYHVRHVTRALFGENIPSYATINFNIQYGYYVITRILRGENPMPVQSMKKELRSGRTEESAEKIDFAVLFNSASSMQLIGRMLASLEVPRYHIDALISSICSWAMGAAADCQQKNKSSLDLHISIHIDKSFFMSRALDEVPALHPSLTEALIAGAAIYNGTADEDNCVICRETFEEEEEIVRLVCSHFFHPDCILQQQLQQKSECPCCRHQIGCP